MDKKVFKMYEAPEVEIVNVEFEAQILAGSESESNVPGVDSETPEEEL